MDGITANRAKFFALLLAAVLCFAANNSAHGREYILNASSSKFYVVDGDTIHYGKLKLRLCGIQAPERNQFHYRRATEMLRGFIGRGIVRAYTTTTDKYGRKIAVLFANGAAGKNRISINEKMVQRGGAKHYRRFSANCAPHISQARLQSAQTQAQKKRRGIWRR